MCLINFHIHEHPTYKLIIAANRDEFYERPTAQAHFWDDNNTILAGRDLRQMGTWLGVSKQGRFAALTNIRDPKQNESNKRSRGEIVSNYLTSSLSPIEYLEQLHTQHDQYNGFNVLVGNQEHLYYYNNLNMQMTRIPNGTHGVSNHLLNTPWPKVTQGKVLLHQYVSSQKTIRINDLFEILGNQHKAEDLNLPQTGVGIELERELSPLFIKTETYGTRSSTVVLIDKDDQVTFAERTYDHGNFTDEQQFSFHIQS